MSGGNNTIKTKHDWSHADVMTDEQVHATALADPDAQPLTDERPAQIKPVPRAKIIRQALDLTHEEFAARFHTPLGTLRDWKQGAVCLTRRHRLICALTSSAFVSFPDTAGTTS